MPSEKKQSVEDAVIRETAKSGESIAAPIRAAVHGAGIAADIRDGVRVAAPTVKTIAPAVYRGAVARSGPLAIVSAVADAGQLAASKSSRDKAHADAEKDADKHGVVRAGKGAVKGFFSPVRSLYGAGSQVKEMWDSGNSAIRSQERLSSALDEQIARKKKKRSSIGIVDPPIYKKP
jgi:hypothetical protein